MKTRIFLSLLLVALLVLAGWEAQAGGIVKKVNCTKGQTITRALGGCDGIPVTIQVKGTCSENVDIARDDVTLIPDPLGGTVIGPDPNQPTILVRGFRTVIDGLTISGGSNGIGVRGNATVQDCTVQNTGANGISFFHGGNGTVDHCTVQSNGGIGVVVEGGSATVINSVISSNTNAGIVITVGGSARIGITDRNQYAGNTISNNQGTGILIAYGGSATIGGNTVSGNGTNANSPFGFFGVLINTASANLVGGNSITGNSGPGVLAENSGVRIGNPSLGLSTINVITGNGTTPVPAAPNGGIYAFRGSSLQIENATINGNTGNGLFLLLNSNARVYNSTLNNNSGNGILLALDSSLLLQNPVVTVTGNAQFGLQCGSDEDSFTGNPSGISGNTVGDVSPSCTGF